jgi:hypothetical protein
VRAAVAKASDNDIVITLANRLANPRPKSRAASVTVAIDDSTVNKLNDMAERSELPIEHVLRLIMERYIQTSLSYKESHGTSSSLEPAPAE